jgi:hypothetical protein
MLDDPGVGSHPVCLGALACGGRRSLRYGSSAPMLGGVGRVFSAKSEGGA